MFVSNALVKDTEEEKMTKCCDFQNYNLQFLLFCSFLPRLIHSVLFMLKWLVHILYKNTDDFKKKCLSLNFMELQITAECICFLFLPGTVMRGITQLTSKNLYLLFRGRCDLYPDTMGWHRGIWLQFEFYQHHTVKLQLKRLNPASDL